MTCSTSIFAQKPTVWVRYCDCCITVYLSSHLPAHEILRSYGITLARFVCFNTGMYSQSSHKTLSNYCGDFITNMIFQSLIINGELTWYVSLLLSIVSTVAGAPFWLLYRRVPKFWTHLKISNVFCDVSVRKKDWRSCKRGAQAT